MYTTGWFIKYICISFVAISSASVIIMDSVARNRRDVNLIKQTLKDQGFEDLSIRFRQRWFPLHQWTLSKLFCWSFQSYMFRVYYATFKSVLEPCKGEILRAWVRVEYDESIEFDMDEVAGKKDRFDEV